MRQCREGRGPAEHRPQLSCLVRRGRLRSPWPTAGETARRPKMPGHRRTSIRSRQPASRDSSTSRLFRPNTALAGVNDDIRLWRWRHWRNQSCLRAMRKIDNDLPVATAAAAPRKRHSPTSSVRGDPSANRNGISTKSNRSWTRMANIRSVEIRDTLPPSVRRFRFRGPKEGLPSLPRPAVLRR